MFCAECPNRWKMRTSRLASEVCPKMGKKVPSSTCSVRTRSNVTRKSEIVGDAWQIKPQGERVYKDKFERFGQESIMKATWCTIPSTSSRVPPEEEFFC